MYPPVINQAIGDYVLSQLPHRESLGCLEDFFKRTQDSIHFLFEKKRSISDEEAVTCLLKGLSSPSCLGALLISMQNYSVQTFQTSEGKGLLIRLKNNIIDFTPNDHLLIITKIQGKWLFLCPGSSGAFSLFLSDSHFYDQTPEILDYLTRLFKGQPCGRFPDYLNQNIEIDYEVEKASKRLQEGPRTCYDGTKSVIQLWPPKQI